MMRSVLAGLALVSLAACGGATADNAAATTDSTTVATDSAAPATPATVDIVETALAAGSFSTLAQALTAAGLVETLKGPGPFTVFAPTDDAFAKIPPADLQALLADKEALTKVLTYHVVAGNVPSTQVVGMTSATSVEGSAITIAVVDGKVVLNGNSNVIKTDVAASNGVIHVIDAVIMPPKQ
ncbi:MAG: fasciclin domain-containing protein [Gemmatimonadaceae bacterium]|jgi:uncharacterized surface protein with fasciclin (FAS1) repeats|nr:fasciclin domain-containing protein [Gemmatimonadaceae bacterium]